MSQCDDTRCDQVTMGTTRPMSDQAISQCPPVDQWRLRPGQLISLLSRLYFIGEHHTAGSGHWQ